MRVHLSFLYSLAKSYGRIILQPVVPVIITNQIHPNLIVALDQKVTDMVRDTCSPS